MSRTQTLELLSRHKTRLAERFGVTSLALFGSTARGEARDDSDIDILVAFDGPATSECRLRLLSFGPSGQELQDAWEGARAARDRVTGKIKDAGLSPADVSALFDRLTLEWVDEAAEQAKVDGFLGAVPGLAGQSSHAAAILCQWLYAAAERRERIAQADLIDQLAEVGRYLHARDGYWRDWFSVVEPLDPQSHPDIGLESELDRLADQFQQGTSARYEHILARCDIPRRRWLDRIGAGFEKAFVVIVHGASGQGKSALAYRWLHAQRERIAARFREETDTVWIDPLKFFAAVALARPLLQRGLMAAHLSDEQSLTLHRRWERIVLVSLFQGRALDRQAWLIPIYRLTSRDPSVLQGYLDRHRTIARSMVAAITAQDPRKGARHFVIADYAEHQAAVARSKVDSPASGSAVMPGAIG